MSPKTLPGERKKKIYSGTVSKEMFEELEEEVGPLYDGDLPANVEIEVSYRWSSGTPADIEDEEWWDDLEGGLEIAYSSHFGTRHVELDDRDYEKVMSWIDELV